MLYRLLVLIKVQEPALYNTSLIVALFFEIGISNCLMSHLCLFHLYTDTITEKLTPY